MDRVQLKQMAKDQIRGKVGILFLVTLIIAALSGLASAVSEVSPVWTIAAALVITPSFALSYAKVYLNVTAGLKVEVKDAFSGFSDFWSAFKVQFLTGLFTFLWLLLFLIPGIIKALSYSMSMYVLAENPGMPALEAISRSKEMTKGHKMDMFVLVLSFIGWGFLCALTFGLAGIYAIPYMNATYANFYNSIKDNQ